LPEISRFFGIVIRMFAESRAPHHRPHFHAYSQGQVGIFAIDAVELVGGELPARETRLVVAWAEIHRQELLDNWNALQNGRLPSKIEPLR
jgi:hypothetical protein